MNKIIKLDYEEFKELERKAKIHDEQKLSVVIFKQINYMGDIDKEIYFGVYGNNHELAEFIKNNIKEDIDKAVDIKVAEIKMKYEDKEKESDKIIDDVKEDEYKYLTVESLKEILNGREEYITNTIIKTIDKAIREKVSRGCDWFYLFPENFKVSTENKEIQDKATEHFSNIGIDIEWDVKTMSLPICNVKVVK